MAETFKDAYPERFFEMYIAEQNMVGAAQGLATRGKVPFVSTFAAFLTRAHDQIRMSQYSEANLKIVGSHAGVSIGEDGPSQMGLEDLAMFRAMLDSVVLYPADAWATEALVEAAARYCGLVYLRTTRGATPLLYGPDDTFPIGGSKVHAESAAATDATIVAAGVTLHEALAARDGTAGRGHRRARHRPLQHQADRRGHAAPGRRSRPAPSSPSRTTTPRAASARRCARPSATPRRWCRSRCVAARAAASPTSCSPTRRSRAAAIAARVRELVAGR